MVGAEQECAAASVGVDVCDFPGAATPTTDRDAHFKCLHTRRLLVAPNQLDTS